MRPAWEEDGFGAETGIEDHAKGGDGLVGESRPPAPPGKSWALRIEVRSGRPAGGRRSMDS
jgi:hypothetical protein